MPEKLLTTTGEQFVARERSSFRLAFSFVDSAGGAVTPSAITWRHTTLEGGTEIDAYDEVENPTGREYPVAITPAESITLLVTGADLEILAAEAEERYVDRLLTLEWVYTSDEGADLPGKKAFSYKLENLFAIVD